MRYWMEEKGWLQGSLVKQEDVSELLLLTGKDELVKNSKNIALIVASGSCDVANPGDPVVEFSVANYIDNVDGAFCFNKHPRRLHCTLESSMTTEFCINIEACNRVSILKDKIPVGISPDKGKQLSQNELFHYVEWLAGRYKRPAFPSEFDKRVDKHWNKSKRKKAASKVSEKILGIYAKVYPDAEIEENEKYEVDLLAIVVPDMEFEGEDFKKVKEFIGQYKKVLKSGNMNVSEEKILTEFQISLGRFKQYKRFNLDELSYKLNHPLPPEIDM